MVHQPIAWRYSVVRLASVLALATLVAGGNACSESKAASANGVSNTTGAGVCGDKNLPDCPLQNWMKATLKSYLSANDTTRLTKSLEQLAEKAPPGFDGWKDSALAAAKAARAEDWPTVKAECKHCHDQHRNRFRAERRTTPLF